MKYIMIVTNNTKDRDLLRELILEYSYCGYSLSKAEVFPDNIERTFCTIFCTDEQAAFNIGYLYAKKLFTHN